MSTRDDDAPPEPLTLGLALWLGFWGALVIVSAGALISYGWLCLAAHLIYVIR